VYPLTIDEVLERLGAWMDYNTIRQVIQEGQECTEITCYEGPFNPDTERGTVLLRVYVPV